MRRAYLQCALSRAQSPAAAAEDELAKALPTGRKKEHVFCYTFDHDAFLRGSVGEERRGVKEDEAEEGEEGQTTQKGGGGDEREEGETGEKGDLHEEKVRTRQQGRCDAVCEEANEREKRELLHERKQERRSSFVVRVVDDVKPPEQCIARHSADSEHTAEDLRLLLQNNPRETVSMQCLKGRSSVSCKRHQNVAEEWQSSTTVDNPAVRCGKLDLLRSDDGGKEHALQDSSEGADLGDPAPKDFSGDKGTTVIQKNYSSDRGTSALQKQHYNGRHLNPLQPKNSSDTGLHEIPAKSLSDRDTQLLPQNSSENRTPSPQQKHLDHCVSMQFLATGCSGTGETEERRPSTCSSYMRDSERTGGGERSCRNSCAKTMAETWNSNGHDCISISSKTENKSSSSLPCSLHGLLPSSFPLSSSKKSRKTEDPPLPFLLPSVGTSVSPPGGTTESAAGNAQHFSEVSFSGTSATSVPTKKSRNNAFSTSNKEMHELLSEKRREDPHYRKKIDLLKFRRQRDTEKRAAKAAGK